MNVHHIELFYYVARHGGISSAVRNMPYGIQQPAVSSQIARLEKDLGVKLFHRQPFRLTPAGQELFDFAEPFFGNIDAVGRHLRAGTWPQLRVGASELVLKTHLPAVLERVRHRHPQVRLSLRSGFDSELMAWLRDGQLDFAIVPIVGRPPAEMRVVKLVQLPLVLLVPKKGKTRSADELLRNRHPSEPLITLPAREGVSVLFQRGLRQRRVDWQTRTEASSLELITHYVATGHGVGVTVLLPEVTNDPRVRILPLDGFEPLEVAAMWRGEPSELIAALVEEGQRYVAEHWS